MQVCPHCGRESRAIDRYCLHCGQRLRDSSDERIETMPAYTLADGNGVASWSTSRPDLADVSPQPLSRPTPPTRVTEPVAAVHPVLTGRLVLKPREGTQEFPREYLLDGRDIAIGRAPSCDVVLSDDQLASRRHSLLRYEGDHYTISDLGSSNGTCVNGVEIHDVTVLADGDHITVGEHELIYSKPAARTTDGFPIPVPPPWPPTAAGALASDIASTRKTAVPAPASASDAAPEPAPADEAEDAVPSSGEPSSPAITPPPAPAPIPPSSALLADIEQLRARLVETSAGLASRVEEAERAAAGMRATLAGLARHAEAALAAAPADASDEEVDPPPPPDLDSLLDVAQQAADNPRHLDHVTALAMHAGEIVRLIAAHRAISDTLAEIHTRLAALTGDESDES